MNDPEVTENWFSRGKILADKGVPYNERVVGVAIVVASILMVVYFVAHQMWLTGFFTTTFGTLELFMFYGSWVFWIITAGLEGVFGLRLLSRLFDIFGGLIFAGFVTIWFYAVLNLFDGEISITQTQDPLECKKFIQVKKLRNKDYIKTPICLTKQ